MKDCYYTLKHSFKYHSGGSEVDAKSIKLIGPSPTHRSQCQHIKSGFMKLTQEISKNAPKEAKGRKKEVEISGEEIYQLFLLAGDEINNYMDSFEKILANGGGLVDSKEPITHHICESISVEDFENLFGRYLKDFLLLSLIT